MNEILGSFTDDDWARLDAVTAEVGYEPGATIVGEGEVGAGLWLIDEGVVRVERRSDAGVLSLALLGPGQIVGDMAFLDETTASASVVADSAVRARLVEAAALRSLLASDAGFASRFHRSLATQLAQRVRALNTRLAELGPVELIGRGARSLRVGNVSARQLPAGFRAGVAEVERDLAQVEADLEAGSRDAGTTGPVVTAILDRAVALLIEHTTDERVLEIGYEDLLAFRDGEQVAQGLGDHLFRTLFPVLMTAETVSRLYSKPRGFAEDHRTEAALLRGEPGGDSVLGPSVDAWFLARPFCRSRRAAVEALVALLRSLPIADGGLPATALASGSAVELRTLLDGGAPPLRITCIDADREALLATSGELALPPGTTLALVESNVVRVARGEEPIALAPQRVIWALGLLEHLDDTEVVAVLRWAGSCLGDSGELFVSQLDAPPGERAVLDYLLELPLRHRSEAELRSLFTAAGWDGGVVRIEADGSGAGLLANLPAMTTTRYTESYSGVVHSTDDPLGENRLSVAVPDVFGDGGPVWARASLPPGDKPKMPSVGEYVWVSFERGDPEYPVWQAETVADDDDTPKADWGGKYRGRVVNIHDPQQARRLEVTVADVGSAPMWATASSAMGMEDELPGLDADVWIEFENGDVNYPMWVGVA